MLKNYIKLALKVLARRKFFTFISLFGISFTLMVLMLIASFLQTELGSNPPLSRSADLVFIPSLSQQYFDNDTIRDIDTLTAEGLTKYDTTLQVKKREQPSSTTNTGMSYRFLNNYFKEVSNAEATTFFSIDYTYDVYINNSKLTIHTSLTDAGYWKVFDFKFTQGRPYSADEISRGAQSVVITEGLAKKYFGHIDDLVGKEILMDDKHFKIIGVVATPSNSSDYVSSDLYVPYTVYPEQTDPNDFIGGFIAAFLVKNGSKIDNLKKEINNRTTKIPVMKPDEFNYNETFPVTYSELYAQHIMYYEDPAKSQRYLLLILISFISLFVLLPVLNLINLNISRIMDRSSEIGVRKAFGANTNNILFQFIFENIIQTFLGGILGFIFALVAIYLINDSHLLDNVQLTINISFFIICFIISLFFGIISGLLPALKMSKLSIVNALKQNNI